MEKFYDCENCLDKNCKICPACGRNPKVLDVTDSYRKKAKRGYYTTTMIEKRDSNGKLIGYMYNKIGE